MTCALAGGPWPKKCLLQGFILLDTRDGKSIRARDNGADDDGADDDGAVDDGADDDGADANNCDVQSDVEVKLYSSLILQAQHVIRHKSHITSLLLSRASVPPLLWPEHDHPPQQLAAAAAGFDPGGQN